MWLLVVLVPGFEPWVWLLSELRQLLPGVPGCAPAPTAPGRFSFRVDGMLRAGQAGAGMAHSRCQQVRNASFHGQSALILTTRCRACRASREGRYQIRSVSGSASFRSLRSQQPRRRVPAVRSAAMFAAMTQPLLTCEVFEGGCAVPWPWRCGRHLSRRRRARGARRRCTGDGCCPGRR